MTDVRDDAAPFGPAPGDLRLVHHHIGGRGGGGGLTFPTMFDNDLVRVFYEADAEAAAQAEERTRSIIPTTLTRPYFIGRPGVRVRFHINYCPYTSTIRTIDPRFDEYHQAVHGMDYVIGEVTEPLRTVEMESHGLDQVMEREKSSLPAPDFLSVDTEGSEDDVFAGAPGLLDHRVVVVETEVRLNPFFTDGPWLGDIASALFKHGFLFAEFKHIGAMAPMRGRLGTRGKALDMWADATFLKDPTRIRGTDADTALKLRKLAFFALCRGQLEFAQFALGLVPKNSPLPVDAPPYLRFVDQFQRLCGATIDLMPWGFKECYSAERSLARFRTMSPEEEQRIKGANRAVAAREFAKMSRAKDELLRSADAKPMVQLFERYGLPDVARLIERTQQAMISDYINGVTSMAVNG